MKIRNAIAAALAACLALAGPALAQDTPAGAARRPSRHRPLPKYSGFATGIGPTPSVIVKGAWT